MLSLRNLFKMYFLSELQSERSNLWTPKGRKWMVLEVENRAVVDNPSKCKRSFASKSKVIVYAS